MFSCPFTSEKSKLYFKLLVKSSAIFTFIGSIVPSLFKKLITSSKFLAGKISISVTIPASFAFSSGTIICLIPKRFASMHIGNIPFTLFILPSKDNSPIKAILSKFAFFIISIDIKIPIAIGKS